MRDYGTATWLGGDDGCDHVERVMKPSAKSTLEDHGPDGRSPQLDALPGIPYRATCGKCGATRQDDQLGLEATPEQYVANMVAVFREVRRVLRKDGTCWLNLGDSYAGSWGNSGNRPELDGKGGTQRPKEAAYWERGGWDERRERPPSSYSLPGLKPKDLVGIPWRVAFALQEDGWWLRSDIIWAKPNPMPESVTDRPTKAHEYLFLLTKSANYYYDAGAIREPHVRIWDSSNGGSMAAEKYNPEAAYGKRVAQGNAHSGDYPLPHPAGRNKRTVWTIATEAYSEAHFATFPTALVKPCILAGTSERGVCAECGSPWVRVTEKWTEPHPNRYSKIADAKQFRSQSNGYEDAGSLGVATRVRTLDWRPTCQCDAPTVPATVLDPFCGSGTTGLVAAQYRRDFIGIDLNPEYCEMARKRIAPALAQEVLAF